MTLVDLFPQSTWVLELKAKDKKAAIKELLQHLVSSGKLKDDAARKAEKSVLKREGQGSTAIGKGLAIPHAKECSFLKDVTGAFGRSREGIPFDAVDGGLVHVIFLVVSPEDRASQHLDVMKRVARLHLDEKTLRFLAKDDALVSLEEIFREVDEYFEG
jgi:mannitol/fructose-specific phosphotransferase system IIA component (Ntr-type)